MRGIEVIILQSRGKPPLSQSTPDKERSVTHNNCYSKIGALLKSRVLTGTLKSHFSKLCPPSQKKTGAFPRGSFRSCTAQQCARNWPTGNTALPCRSPVDAEGLFCHVEAPRMKAETALRFRGRDFLVSFIKSSTWNNSGFKDWGVGPVIKCVLLQDLQDPSKRLGMATGTGNPGIKDKRISGSYWTFNLAESVDPGSVRDLVSKPKEESD